MEAITKEKLMHLYRLNFETLGQRIRMYKNTLFIQQMCTEDLPY